MVEIKRVPYIRRGAIIEFQISEPPAPSGILGAAVKAKRPEWSGFGWHLAIAYHKIGDDWLIYEATTSGVRFSLLSKVADGGMYRVHNILDHEPRIYTMAEFVKLTDGARYDRLAYLWTALFMLSGRRLPRIVNRRYTCWELVFYWLNFAGYKTDPADYPTIADFEALAIKEQGQKTIEINTFA